MRIFLRKGSDVSHLTGCYAQAKKKKKQAKRAHTTQHSSKRAENPSALHHKDPHTPPRLQGERRRKKEEEKRACRAWRGSTVQLHASLTFFLFLQKREREKKRKKKSVKSLLFLTQKDAEECLKFRRGWRGWNLSPRGQTGGFFSFQALIDSPLSFLATQKDTWKKFLMGLWCEKQGDLLRRRALLTLNEHISPPVVSSVGHFNFSLLLHLLGRILKHSLLPASFYVHQHSIQASTLGEEDDRPPSTKAAAEYFNVQPL